jgi:hypothetical protein
MKAAEWRKIAAPLRPQGETWEFRGDLCYKAPVRRILFGVSPEGSGFDRGAYIWRVKMPLYVPSENHLVLTYSQRIGGGATKFYLDDLEGLRAAIVEAFTAVPSEEEEILKFAERPTETPNIRIAEIIAYSRLLTGDVKGALACADSNVTTAKRAIEAEGEERGWVLDVVSRLDSFRLVLEEQGEKAALAILEQYAAKSAETLGLIREKSS